MKKGSVEIDGMQSVFIVTDGTADITVRYSNALPSLFREGQGVVAEGQIENGVFIAQNVLAKHDENYMPAEVAEKLKSKVCGRAARQITDPCHDAGRILAIIPHR